MSRNRLALPGKARCPAARPDVCAIELDSMLSLYRYAAESIALHGEGTLRAGVPTLLDAIRQRERPAPPVTVSRTRTRAPRLELVRFDYAPVNDRWAVVRLLAGPGAELSPRGVRPGADAARLFGLLESATVDGARGGRAWWPGRPVAVERLWRVSFAIPLEVVEAPAALFGLTPMDRMALALANSDPRLIGVSGDLIAAYLPGRRARRRLVALATTFAVSGVSPLAVSVAAAQASGHGSRAGTSSHAVTTLKLSGAFASKPGTSPAPARSSTPTGDAPAGATSTTHAVAAPARPAHPGKPATASRPHSKGTLDALGPACAASSATRAVTPAPPPPPGTKPPVTTTAAATAAARLVCPPAKAHKRHPAHHTLGRKHAHLPARPAPSHRAAAPSAAKPSPSTVAGLGPTCSARTATSSLGRIACPRPEAGGLHAPAAGARHRHTHKVAAKPQKPIADVIVTPPVPVSAVALGAHHAVASAWSRLSVLLANGDRPPAFLIPIYKAAGHRYHVPWPILAAINAIETNYGRNLDTSSAGAMGWMQFMPSTWAEYGVAAGRHSLPDPYDPRDAIFSAARYLAANGARHNLRKAIFAYNHATWYVDEVLWTAVSIAKQVPARGSIARIKLDAMRAMARGLDGEPYIWGGGHGSWELVSGYDCSGFVSAVLHAAGYLEAPVTTQALPSQPAIRSGPGRFVTIFDRTDGASTAQDHVIIDLGGQWWESGGSGTGVHRLTRVSAAYLLTFNEILHPRGL